MNKKITIHYVKKELKTLEMFERVSKEQNLFKNSIINTALKMWLKELSKEKIQEYQLTNLITWNLTIL